MTTRELGAYPAGYCEYVHDESHLKKGRSENISGRGGVGGMISMGHPDLNKTWRVKT